MKINFLIKIMLVSVFVLGFGFYLYSNINIAIYGKQEYRNNCTVYKMPDGNICRNKYEKGMFDNSPIFNYCNNNREYIEPEYYSREYIEIINQSCITYRFAN